MHRKGGDPGRYVDINESKQLDFVSDGSDQEIQKQRRALRTNRDYRAPLC